MPTHFELNTFIAWTVRFMNKRKIKVCFDLRLIRLCFCPFVRHKQCKNNENAWGYKSVALPENPHHNMFNVESANILGWLQSDRVLLKICSSCSEYLSVVSVRVCLENQSHLLRSKTMAKVLVRRNFARLVCKCAACVCVSACVNNANVHDIIRLHLMRKEIKTKNQKKKKIFWRLPIIYFHCA